MNIELNKLSVPDIEIQVLQNIFLQPTDFYKVEHILKPEFFYNYKRQMIYEAMSKLYADFEELTYNTVIAHFASRGKLGDGTEQLTPYEIMNCGGDADKHIPNFNQNIYLAKIISENYIKREFIKNSHKSIDAIFKGDTDFSQIIAESNENNGNLLNISEGNRNKHISDYAESFIEDNQENGGGKFPTGYAKIDDRLAIRGGHLVIIGAGTSHGKTVLALNLARNFAKNNKKVGFFSLEMTGEELTNRVISNEISINSGVFKHKLNNTQLRDYRIGKAKVSEYKFYINDKAGLSINRLKSYAVNMVKNLGVECIVIDYLQLIKGTGKNKYESTTDISQSLKIIAKDLNVPVIALSQFSRAFAKENRLPVVSDLRDSGSIEQDADSIILLYNFDKAKAEVLNDDGSIIENGLNIEIAKDRHGECFSETLYIDGKYQRIQEAEVIEDPIFGTNSDFENNDDKF